MKEQTLKQAMQYTSLQNSLKCTLYVKGLRTYKKKSTQGSSIIHGATVDVSAAFSLYQQFSLSKKAARLRSTLVLVHHKNRPKTIFVVILVEVFGDTLGSHVYNTIGTSSDLKHNQQQGVTKSQIYIDDGIIVGREKA
jgi:hypothetical protein